VWALSGGSFPLALGVLQILCLDIGTDILPALALGAEPPSTDVLARAPAGRRLLDAGVLRRALLVLGPTEALAAMTAFVVAFLAGGWWFGSPMPEGHVLRAASGAAFAAVVFGQAANAFACRSTVRVPWRVPRHNELLARAVGVELLALAVFELVPPIARALSQAPPPAAALAVALLAAPAVLAADALTKLRQRRAQSSSPSE
jgi:magnesium-transporting ATPase (P-type)